MDGSQASCVNRQADRQRGKRERGRRNECKQGKKKHTQHTTVLTLLSVPISSFLPPEYVCLGMCMFIFVVLNDAILRLQVEERRAVAVSERKFSNPVNGLG